jgi:hypothetical protein
MHGETQDRYAVKKVAHAKRLASSQWRIDCHPSIAHSSHATFWVPFRLKFWHDYQSLPSSTIIHSAVCNPMVGWSPAVVAVAKAIVNILGFHSRTRRFWDGRFYPRLLHAHFCVQNGWLGQELPSSCIGCRSLAPTYAGFVYKLIVCTISYY